MAVEANIGGDGSLFTGEDKTLTFQVLSDGSVTPKNEPIDISAWTTIYFDIRKTDAATAAVIEKIATVVGVYNIVKALNTQRARIVLDDDDTNLLQARTYRYSLTRMDEAAETVLFFGNFVVQQASAR